LALAFNSPRVIPPPPPAAAAAAAEALAAATARRWFAAAGGKGATNAFNNEIKNGISYRVLYADFIATESFLVCILWYTSIYAPNGPWPSLAPRLGFVNISLNSASLNTSGNSGLFFKKIDRCGHM
jgi:hypothetical protein